MHSYLSLQVLENVHLGKINDDFLLPKRSCSHPSWLCGPSLAQESCLSSLTHPWDAWAVISVLAEGSLGCCSTTALSAQVPSAGGVCLPKYTFTKTPHSVPHLCRMGPHGSAASLSSWAECSPCPKSAPARSDPLVSGNLSNSSGLE